MPRTRSLHLSPCSLEDVDSIASSRRASTAATISPPVSPVLTPPDPPKAARANRRLPAAWNAPLDLRASQCTSGMDVASEALPPSDPPTPTRFQPTPPCDQTTLRSPTSPAYPKEEPAFQQTPVGPKQQTIRSGFGRRSDLRLQLPGVVCISPENSPHVPARPSGKSRAVKRDWSVHLPPSPLYSRPSVTRETSCMLPPSPKTTRTPITSSVQRASSCLLATHISRNSLDGDTLDSPALKQRVRKFAQSFNLQLQEPEILWPSLDSGLPESPNHRSCLCRV